MWYLLLIYIYMYTMYIMVLLCYYNVGADCCCYPDLDHDQAALVRAADTLWVCDTGSIAEYKQ